MQQAGKYTVRSSLENSLRESACILATMHPTLALTMGDPGGIGPEILVKALDRAPLRRRARWIVVGDADVLERARLRHAPGLAWASSVDEGPVLDAVASSEPLGNRWGQVSAAAGRAALASLERAIVLAREGTVQGIVTPPIHKKALSLAGESLIGHTEILAHRTGTTAYALMLVHKRLRVVHTTCHVSLVEAARTLTTDRVFTAIRLAWQALVDLGVREPRIGVAGLNPHAGEDGLMGTEDAQVIRPAVMLARVKGVLAEGPLPPDTVFPRLLSGDLDVVVAQYHDQGHIPFKLLTFRHRRGHSGMHAVAGVNVTLGLPFVRTSVDHGVAFEIAGEGRADPSSMVEAMNLACLLARGRAKRAL